MATLALTGGMKGIPTRKAGSTFIVEREIDLQAEGVATADVVQALNIEAGWFVHKTLVEIQRIAAGTSGSLIVGDGADPNGFDTAVDLKGAVGTVSSTGLVLAEGAPNTLVDAYAAGKYYTAADTLDLTATLHADLTDKGKVKVIALVTSFN